MTVLWVPFGLLRYHRPSTGGSAPARGPSGPPSDAPRSLKPLMKGEMLPGSSGVSAPIGVQLSSKRALMLCVSGGCVVDYPEQMAMLFLLRVQ